VGLLALGNAQLYADEVRYTPGTKCVEQGGRAGKQPCKIVM
jgi:hypothetical protein